MRASTRRRTEGGALDRNRRRLAVIEPVVVLFALGVSACGGGSDPGAASSSTNDVDSGTVVAATFAEVYNTVLGPVCKTCHQPGGLAPFQDFSTQSGAYAALVDVKASGPSCGAAGETRVVAGDASQSLLFQKISQASPPCGSQMPLGGPPLSQAQMSLIENRINEGAKND